MLPDFRSNHCSNFWRAIYIVCMVFVFSYIFFDVLDLDGSDSPFKRHPLERTAIVAEVAKDTVRAYSVERPELWVDLSTLFPALPCEAMWVRLTRTLTFSRLNSVRTHGYRIALPRSSPSDPFQSL
jgi:hypothetical protein